MNKKVLIILADGFEEIEAITVFDLLKRQKNIEVILAGLNQHLITSCRGLKIQTDVLLQELIKEIFDAPRILYNLNLLDNQPMICDQDIYLDRNDFRQNDFSKDSINIQTFGNHKDEKYFGTSI